MRRFVFLLVLCLLPHVASAAELTPRPEGITRREALAMRVEELAKRLFGPPGDVIYEVMRPSYLPPNLRDDPVLTDLKLATRPTALGSGGLCVAEVITMTFAAPPPSERKLGPQYERAKPTSLKTAPVFKVVGSAASCNEAGRVLPTNSTTLSQKQYFEVEGANPTAAAQIAALVLQRSLGATAKQDTLTMDALVKVAVAPCKTPARTCVEGVFLPSEGRATPTYWKVSVEADVTDGAVKTLHKTEVSPITIQRD